MEADAPAAHILRQAQYEWQIPPFVVSLSNHMGGSTIERAMPYLAVNGLRLYYEISGDPNAPPALLISGLGGDHRGWRAVASRLEASFRVISFDNRDSGLSQRAQTPYAIRDMAEDAAGLLRELGVDSANVAGY